MKFKYRRTIDGTDAEVVFEDLDEIDTALDSLLMMIQSVRIGDARRRALLLWSQSNGFRQIIESVEESGERIALSLLDRWPNPTRNADIVSDTGLSRAGVYDHITGRRGNKADWFSRNDDLYSLSEIGEEEVIRLVNDYVNEEE